MKTTYNTIPAIQEAIQNSTNIFKTKQLKEELSWMKAKSNNNYVTKEHLIEFKALIIFIAKKSFYFQNNSDLQLLMSILLDMANKNEIVFRTSKGIKNILANQTKLIANSINMKHVEVMEGEEIFTNSNLRAEGTLYYIVQMFNLNNLTN